MYYIFNNGVNGKKKNSNPYRKAIKGLVEEIKSIDIDSLIKINNIGHRHTASKIEALAVLIKTQDSNINYKSIESKLKELYKNSNVEELLYMYISVLNNLLCEEKIASYAMRTNTPLEKIFTDYEEFESRVKSRVVLATICLYAIIIGEQLLDKKIDMIDLDENSSDIKIVKGMKVEHMSLLKGINGIPLLLTKKEALLVNELVEKFKYNSNKNEIIHYTLLMYSYKCIEDIVSMYCFGKELKDYVALKEFTSLKSIESERYSSCVVSVDLFHNRKLLPPANGVILKLRNHKAIESVYIRECTKFSFRIIYGLVRYKNGHEQPISIRMNYYPNVNLHCRDAGDVMSTILDFYEVPRDIIESRSSLPKASEYDVISPYYWRWRHHGYEAVSSEQLKLPDKNAIEKNIKIATYVRNIKGTASDEARKLAEKVHIVLGENQTLVREHDRIYNKSN